MIDMWCDSHDVLGVQRTHATMPAMRMGAVEVLQLAAMWHGGTQGAYCHMGGSEKSDISFIPPHLHHFCSTEIKSNFADQ